MNSPRDDRTGRAERAIAVLSIGPKQKQALQAAARDLARDRRVLAVAVTGSVGRGRSDPNDIDLVVLTRGSRYGTRRCMYHGQRVHMLTRGVERFLAAKKALPTRPGSGGIGKSVASLIRKEASAYAPE